MFVHLILILDFFSTDLKDSDVDSSLRVFVPTGPEGADLDSLSQLSTCCPPPVTLRALAGNQLPQSQVRPRMKW